MAKKPVKPTLKLVDTKSKSPLGNSTQPQRKLGEHGQALWESIMAEYQIDDCGGLEVLTQICSALDRSESLAAEVDRDGPIVMTKSGPKEHPALRAELGCRAFITRNLQRLGLNLENPKPLG